MATEAYLVCHEKQTAFYLGKFMGTWCPVDWTSTDVESFAVRIVNAWCGEDGEYIEEGNTVAHARSLANPLFSFCADHDWKVEIVEVDWFFDNGFERPDHLSSSETKKMYDLLGSRTEKCWRGYDMPKGPKQ